MIKYVGGKFGKIMSVLEIEDLNFGYRGEVLLKNVNMRLLPGEHMGLIGANGSGKTTLMNMIAHRLAPDSGKVNWFNNTSFSYLDQHLKIHDELTIHEYLYQVYDELFLKEKEMNDLYSSLEEVDESKYDKILNKAYNIQNYLDEHDFYMIKSKISNVINGLGINYDENWVLKNLSSGQRGKVFLAKMLLEEKDVLLLDEPTNFLDVSHIEWLSKFLVGYKKEFIVISHDNNFLNRVCNVICAIENKTIVHYKGNYDDYLRLKDIRSKQYEQEYIAQQKYIKKTQEFIDKNIVRASTTHRAQSRRKELEKVVVLEKPVVEKKVKFNFPFSASFNSEAVVTNKLVIGYNKPILSPIDCKIYFGEKIVITGKNGIGKSTFIKTLLGEVPLISGKIKIPFYNKIVYFSQEYSGDLTISAIEYIKNDYPLMDDKKVRDLLGQYGIVGELAIKKLKELSGGELTKVRFAKLQLENSNLLILDEPTNHLDKNAKEALYNALNEYPGTILLVTHEKEINKKMKMREIHFS